MTELPTPITADDLRGASWRLAVHLNMGGQGGQSTYQCSAFPELLVCKGWSKKKGVSKSYAVMQIRRGSDDHVEVPLGDLDEVARVLTKVRQGLADDIEWQRADPTSKAAAEIAQAARERIGGGA